MRRKLFTFILLGLSGFGTLAYGQENVIRAYVDEDIPGTVNGVSENGEWAVGCDGGIVTYAAFVWNKRAGRFVDVWGLESDGSMGTSGLNCEAYLYDVSNDGIAVGSFADGRNPIDGSKVPVLPGYFNCTTKEWTVLPGLDGVEILSGVQNGYASKISPDGRIIAGQVPYKNGCMVPVLWIDGKIQRVDDLEYEGQGGYVSDMTDDGSVLVGFAEWEDGSRAPAVFKDGKRVRLIGTEPAMSDVEKWEYFYYGRASSISPDGKQVGGEFNPGTGGYGFLWNIPDDFESDVNIPEEEVEKINFLVSHIGLNGRVFGSSSAYGPVYIIDNGEQTDFGSFYGNVDGYTPAVVFDANADETTFASTVVSSIAGNAVNAPMVLTIDYGESSIDDNAASGVVVNAFGGILNIYGTYSSVSIYNTSGVCLMKDNSGKQSFDVSGYEHGVYVVKVENDRGTETAKIML